MDQNSNQNNEETVQDLFKEVPPSMVNLDGTRKTEEVINFELPTYTPPVTSVEPALNEVPLMPSYELPKMESQVSTAQSVTPSAPIFELPTYTPPTTSTESMTQSYEVPPMPSYEIPTTQNDGVVSNSTFDEPKVEESPAILFDNPVVNQSENYNNPVPNMVDSIEVNQNPVAEEVKKETIKKSSSDKSGIAFIAVLFGLLLLFVLFLQPISDFISKLTG